MTLSTFVRIYNHPLSPPRPVFMERLHRQLSVEANYPLGKGWVQSNKLIANHLGQGADAYIETRAIPGGIEIFLDSATSYNKPASKTHDRLIRKISDELKAHFWYAKNEYTGDWFFRNTPYDDNLPLEYQSEPG